MSLSIETTTPDERSSAHRVLGLQSKLPLNEWWKRLDTTSDGLSENAAHERLMKYGLNRLEQKHKNPVVRLLTSFWGPIAWMIEIAAVLSILAHDTVDFLAILAILLVNAVVYFWQEVQSANAAEALKKQLALKSRVKRAGKWREIDAAHLAPGDVIRLRTGDIVPADVVFLEGVEGGLLSVDQSALFGDSLPVEKKTTEAGYAGSIVKKGELDALVIHTGRHTYLGKTRKLAPSGRNPSRFLKTVMKTGNYLIYLSLATAGLLFLVMLLRGSAGRTLQEFALIFLVAAIPAVMPAILSATVAIGGRALSKMRAVPTRPA